jgi:protoheme IX farnesyltransferase
VGDILATQELAEQAVPRFRVKVRLYWQLIKSLQTGLLLITGIAGFMSVCCPVKMWSALAGMVATLFLAISGSTVLNMVYDRDIDARMKRTAQRPLPSGQLSTGEALRFGVLLSTLGVGGALLLDPWYGVVVGAGLTFDVMVYTIWLKRRTPWSILWGGIAGGMPILAGRTLGTGQIEHIGLLLALAVLLWIPTHIMTYGIKHAADYKRAGVPTFANHYGERVTRVIISVSTILAVLTMALCAWLIGLHAHCLYATIGLGVTLAALTAVAAVFPSPKLNFGTFKFASVYMLASMLLIIVGK